jgi:hypothetical protein
MKFYKGKPIEVLQEGPRTSQILDANMNEYWVPNEGIKDSVVSSRVSTKDAHFHRYSTDYDRAARTWTFVRWYPELAWIVGFAAQQNAYLRHSGQPNDGTAVEDEFEFGADSNGEKFDAVMPNPNYIGLDAALDINFIHRGSPRRVSLNKQGFWKLLESLGFQIGKNQEQDVHAIQQAVPVEYLADFQAGGRGSVPIILDKR